jgi:hypothetical protein
MEFETALALEPSSSCNFEVFRISSAASTPATMTRSPLPFQPMLAGLVLTLAQIFVAVCLLAPEGPFSYRYSTLVQHDGYWFMNIVNRGYATTVPPINHKVMEVSNVAFFPAYPAIAALLRRGLNLETSTALLIVSQAAAWGFWTYFFLFCKRWNLSPALQFFGAMSIFAHPAAFFLVAGYSESLFLMGLIGFIYWSGAQGPGAKIWAALHGMLMSATRIVGIVCAAYPIVTKVFAQSWNGLRDWRGWWQRYRSAVELTIAAASGAILFFVYCQLRWGHWDMYMLTQTAGWGITPDYLAAFRPSSYHWLFPALNNPTEMSQMAMTVGALLFIAIAICEFLPVVRRQSTFAARAGIYFCAVAIYYISVSGVASVEMESMLRYEFCVHVLMVLALLQLFATIRVPSALVRAFGMGTMALVSAIGFSVQGWYVWNFTRGNWVA